LLYLYEYSFFSGVLTNKLYYIS